MSDEHDLSDWSPEERKQLRKAMADRLTRRRSHLRADAIEEENAYRRGRRWKD